MADFTDEEKFACLERELKLRCNVYAKRVRAGQMLPVEADREIALMRSIADDYRPQTLFPY